MEAIATVPLFLALMCLLMATGVWFIVIRTPLIQSLLGTFEPTVYTRQDVEEWLTIRQSWKLLKLYTCNHCQAFWTALLAALLFDVSLVTCWSESTHWMPMFPIFTLIFTPLTSWMQKGH